MNPVRPLAGRVALVTGAGPGLGRALARSLAEAGANLVVCDINEAGLTAARATVEEAGAECLTVRCDISDSAAVQRMFAQAAERFGTVHILVNNAALTPNRPSDDVRRRRHYTHLTTPVPRQSLEFTRNITDDEWHRWWGVNVHGVFYCTREALKLMEPQKYGRIINIASLSGMSGLSAHSPHYSATKGAVIAFTKAVAAEVAGSNIYVNVMAPGGVHTRTSTRSCRRWGRKVAIASGSSCPRDGWALPKNTPPRSCTWRASTTWPDRSFRPMAAC